MKSFACALLFVAAAYASPAAEAEADPALLYSNLGYNYGINGYAGYAVGNPVFNTYAAAPYAAAVAAPAVATAAVAAPLVKSVVSTPAVVNTVATQHAAIAAPAFGYAASPYNYAYSGLYNGLYNGAYNGLYNHGLGYNNLALGYANTHVIAKREADAESEADPALLYSGLPAYNYGYSGYAAASPLIAPYANRAFAYGFNTYNYGASPYSAYRYAGYPYAARYY